MRLHDIESAQLLPRFAHNAEWEQNALDQVVKGVRAKSFAMGAPYTRAAISALSDAELQSFYFQYGIAIYYPDLSRETRENMLFELARVYRSLGTPHSVELLCEYIFDGADKVEVEIHDNLAFDASGVLVDDSLLDLFDVNLFPAFPELSQDKIERIVESIFRFCRNSQTLRDVIVEFPSVAECPVTACDFEALIYTIGGDEIADVPTLFPIVYHYSGTQTAASIAADASFDTGLQYYASKLYIGETNDGQGNVTRYGWEAVEGTPAPAYIDVNFYYRPEGTGVTFGANDYWGSIVVDSTSKGILEAFGVSLYNYSGSSYCVSKTGNSGFTFEILGLYYGTTDLGADLTNFYLENGSTTDTSSPYYGLNIKSRNSYSTSTNYWKCRITRNL